MDIKDRDLQSIQEVRALVKEAKKAQKEFANFDIKLINEIVKQLSIAAFTEAESLGKMTVEETGFGIWQDKMTKNVVASEKLYEHIKDMKTIGIINEDENKKIVEIGTPVGVIAALIPSTNPTSTVIYKTLIALKSGNAIIFSPHPSAIKCILKTVEVLKKAAARMGAPKGLISCISIPTLEGTNELMKHDDVSLILATGGTAMVKAAYSSGTPALGVGPGNVPAFIERSADINRAVSKILASKTFDNGTVCASEQAIVTERCIADSVKAELTNQGGYFLTGKDIDKVTSIMEKPNGAMNPKIVGKSAKDIADMAGIIIPDDTKLLICEEKGVGKEYPFSKEKLTQLLAFYTVEDWVEGCELCYRLLENGGIGHTLAIHSNNEEVIREFALKKPVSRFLVNTPSTQGAIGLSTGLTPALTLGCGAVGGSATSDNVGPEHLINIRRMAYEVDDLGIAPQENKSTDKLDIDTICKIVIQELQKVKK